MELAVEKLAAVLKEQDLQGTLDQSADTQELITKISSEISRMINEDDEDFDDDDDGAGSRFGGSDVFFVSVRHQSFRLATAESF